MKHLELMLVLLLLTILFTGCSSVNAESTLKQAFKALESLDSASYVQCFTEEAREAASKEIESVINTGTELKIHHLEVRLKGHHLIAYSDSQTIKRDIVEYSCDIEIITTNSKRTIQVNDSVELEENNDGFLITKELGIFTDHNVESHSDK